MNIVYQKSIKLNSSLKSEGISIDITLSNNNQIKSFVITYKTRETLEYKVSDIALASVNYFLKQLDFKRADNLELEKLVKCKGFRAFLLGFLTFLSFFELFGAEGFKNKLPFKFFVPSNLEDGDCHHYHILKYMSLPVISMSRLVKDQWLANYLTVISQFIKCYIHLFPQGPQIGSTILHQLYTDVTEASGLPEPEHNRPKKVKKEKKVKKCGNQIYYHPTISSSEDLVEKPVFKIEPVFESVQEINSLSAYHNSNLVANGNWRDQQTNLSNNWSGFEQTNLPFNSVNEGWLGDQQSYLPFNSVSTENWWPRDVHSDLPFNPVNTGYLCQSESWPREVYNTNVEGDLRWG